MEHVNLNVLFNEKRPILNHFASQFTSDYDEKQDLIQETSIRALKSIHHFIQHPKLMTWLYVIMKNIYINQYQQKKRKNFIYDHYAMILYKDNITVNKTESKMLGDDIKKAIDSLQTDHAEIFRMYLEGYRYHEIAACFSIPEGTIKSRIHVARKVLQGKLKMHLA